jgi:hypothetical protein
MYVKKLVRNISRWLSVYSDQNTGQTIKGWKFNPQIGARQFPARPDWLFTPHPDQTKPLLQKIPGAFNQGIKLPDFLTTRSPLPHMLGWRRAELRTGILHFPYKQYRKPNDYQQPTVIKKKVKKWVPNEQVVVFELFAVAAEKSCDAKTDELGYAKIKITSTLKMITLENPSGHDAWNVSSQCVYSGPDLPQQHNLNARYVISGLPWR